MAKSLQPEKSDLKKAEILKERKKELSKLIGVPFNKIIERFTGDLLGCGSGGSNERDHAREWFLFTFRQYIRDDEDLRREASYLLDSFQEPTIWELNGEEPPPSPWEKSS